jgi:hypothetical protein
MSTDPTWFTPADAVRPDHRVRDGQRAPADPRARNGGRPPDDDDHENGAKPPRRGPASGRKQPSAPDGPLTGPKRPDRGAASREPAPPPAPQSYPIVAQYELGDPERRGPLGLVRRRQLDDIPKIKPHELLVWRVGSRYVVDRRELRAHDDTLVRASSVSVVSVRPDTEVMVSFRIDSQDAAEFTVKVIFICSVLDPVVVVRDGQVNAADALIAYLRGYQDLFDLGLMYPIKQINRVRTEMAIQVKSYMALRPPKIPGLAITSATVQIETPPVLAGIRKLTAAQEIELRKQDHEALLDSNRQAHILEKARGMEDVSRTPEAALGLAYADGGMASSEYADRISQMEESRQQRDRMDALAATARKQELEDRHWQRQHELEDRSTARRHELEDRADQWHYEEVQWTREERRAQAEWKRARAEARWKDELEGRRAQVNADIELLKLYAANGHLDTFNADIEDIVRRIHGDHTRPQLPAGDKPESADDPEFAPDQPEAGRDY